MIRLVVVSTVIPSSTTLFFTGLIFASAIFGSVVGMSCDIIKIIADQGGIKDKIKTNSPDYPSVFFDELLTARHPLAFSKICKNFTMRHYTNLTKNLGEQVSKSVTIIKRHH